MKKKLNIFIILSLLIIIVVILGNSFLPGEISKKISDKFVSFLRLDNLINTYFARKIFGHFLIFTFLGIVVVLSQYKYKINIYLCILFGIMISLISETIQNYTSGRFYTVEDIIINSMGYILPTIVFINKICIEIKYNYDIINLTDQVKY